MNRPPVLATSDLDYDLPEARIATRPVEPRDSARLLVVSRSDASVLEHRRFSDIGAFLRAPDLLVRNTTTVLPARFEGTRADTGGRVGGLFLRRVMAKTGAQTWSVMLRSNGKLRPGMRLDLHPRSGSDNALRLTLLGRDPDDESCWVVEVLEEKGRAYRELLEGVGHVPLPPYIQHARKMRHEPAEVDQDETWYRTVYADEATVDEAGASVAAPTAGMHFTSELLDKLRQQGVESADVVLHVGIGTFRPIEADSLAAHIMHTERCVVARRTLDTIGRTRKANGRCIAVGTTTARALESVALPGFAPDVMFDTGIFITPGHQWRNVDALITNFHLPRSTLLAMVASLFPEGVPRLLEIYAAAIEEEYRFYSYGDAMLILP